MKIILNLLTPTDKLLILRMFMKQLNKHEDLIVWMRTAALPTFWKLYGRIEVDLEKGPWYCRIGTTRIVLAARRNLYCQLLVGLVGRKTSLALLIYRGLSSFLAMALTILYFVKPR
ncbi:unnamed protein product [Vicia faba]|uniref:Uncharacterized protein n=1 Tax=Vicia faba TaxID=3906 RepID=A0AAV1A8Q2_VICFA|nr:unnamed protein product [Vicia faba]